MSAIFIDTPADHHRALRGGVVVRVVEAFVGVSQPSYYGYWFSRSRA
ncbi:hypothetical protein [Halotalea alkalilenta]|nr:hypothetical protein [Halotalea alkalilenta]